MMRIQMMFQKVPWTFWEELLLVYFLVFKLGPKIVRPY